MKIVVLDGYTLNPGDLSWSGLEAIGDLEVFDRTPADLVVERAAECDILFTNKTPLPAETIDSLQKVKYIGVLATGYNVIDVDAAKKKGIVVTNIPTYGTQSVAQMVFAHLLHVCHHVSEHADAVKKGAWADSGDFCFWNYPLIELDGKSLGIIGLGRIGQAVAKIAQAFGMTVMAYDPGKMEPEIDGVRIVNFDELLNHSDIISLHCPLTPENHEMINASTITKMKKGVILINTSRGQLIKDQDLAEALYNGQVAAAGLDVMEDEPPSNSHILMKTQNCYITPHIAWAPYESRSRLMKIAVENLQNFLAGKATNLVN